MPSATLSSLQTPSSQMPRCSRCGNEGHLMTNQNCPTLVAERQQKAQRDLEAATLARQRETKEALKEEAALIKEKLALVKEASAIVGNPTDAIAALMASNDRQMAEAVATRDEWNRKKTLITNTRAALWEEAFRAHRGEEKRLEDIADEARQRRYKAQREFQEETDRLVLEAFSKDNLEALRLRIADLAEEREHLIAFTTRTIAREEFLSPIKGLAGEKLLLRRLEAGIIAEGEVCPVYQEPLVAGDIHIAPCGHAYSKAGWKAAMEAPASRGECALCRNKPDIHRMICLNSDALGHYGSSRTPLTARERKLAKRMGYAPEAVPEAVPGTYNANADVPV